MLVDEGEGHLRAINGIRILRSVKDLSWWPLDNCCQQFSLTQGESPAMTAIPTQ